MLYVEGSDDLKTASLKVSLLLLGPESVVTILLPQRSTLFIVTPHGDEVKGASLVCATFISSADLGRGLNFANGLSGVSVLGDAAFLAANRRFPRKRFNIKFLAFIKNDYALNFIKKLSVVNKSIPSFKVGQF
jgi:hypothetical protein